MKKISQILRRFANIEAKKKKKNFKPPDYIFEAIIRTVSHK